MEIIDAHLHFCADPYFDEIARQAGHENTAGHLAAEYRRLGIVKGIVMGNRSLETSAHEYPDFIHYCIGLDAFTETLPIEEQAGLVEENLKREECVGIKLYPGYKHFYIYEKEFAPIYALSEKYMKPVAVHTGLTASNNGLLKYSHPLVLDEAAVRWPQVQFVMCHFGNPWLEDAVGVLEKNPNVAADFSGLLEQKISDSERFVRKKQGYMRMLKDWLEYLDCYDRIMFGTDWPLANLEDYIWFMKKIIPQEEWEKVFFSTANRIYGLGL